MTLKIGDKAPEFSLPDQEGKTHSLKDYKGKKVVLYFYPKDDTPGCTKEACNFRDDYTKIKKLGAIILGVSKDKVSSHKKFSEKYELPFPLLSDESTEMIKSYDAWKPKKFMGREFLGVVRITYIIDEKGKISHVFPQVKPDVHSKEVIAAL